MKYKFSYFLLNIPKTSYVYHIYHHNHLLQIGSSYCLFNYEKKEDLFHYNTKHRRKFKNYFYDDRYVDNHHIIPKQFTNHPLLCELNVDVSCSKNIIFLQNRYAKSILNSNTTIYHQSHPKYNKFIDKELQRIYNINDKETKKYEFMLMFMYLNQCFENNDPFIRKLFFH